MFSLARKKQAWHPLSLNYAFATSWKVILMFVKSILGFHMRKGRKRSALMRIVEGASEEEAQAFLSKLARQLHSLTPPGADVSLLDQIEADVQRMRLIFS
jgi:hypothetical protein